MKTIPILLTLVLGFANLSVQSAEPPPRSEKANKLLKERLDILLTILDGVKASNKQGAASADELMNAQLAVYSALVDMSTNKDERIKIYTQMLDELHKMAPYYSEMLKSGKMTANDFKQHRLREIDIELSIEAERAEK